MSAVVDTRIANKAAESYTHETDFSHIFKDTTRKTNLGIQDELESPRHAYIQACDQHHLLPDKLTTHKINSKR